VKLQGELTLNLPSKEWLSTKIAWPLAMSNVSSEGNVLAYIEKDAKERELIVFAKGPGVREAAIRSRGSRASADCGLGEHTLEAAGRAIWRRVESRTAYRTCSLLAGSAHERRWSNRIKVAFDHRELDDYDSNESQISRNAFRVPSGVRWIEAPPQIAPRNRARYSETAQRGV
jgi:hypothetical protein